MEYLQDDQLKVYFQDGSEVVVSVLGEEDGVYKCNALSKNEVYSEGDVVYVDPNEQKIEKISIKKKSGVYEEDDEMFDDPYGQEDAFNFSHPGKTYEFYVNLDERGSFYADVRDPDTDESIYEIDTEKIQQLGEDGYMRHNQDYEGLESYLKQLDIIKEDDGIILRRGIKKKSQRFNWEFDKHQSQYIYNKKTGEIEKEESAVTKIGKTKDDKYYCEECGKEMNALDYMMNPVCLECAKKKHKEVTGKLKKKSGLYYDSDEKWQKLVEEYSLEELKLKIINYFKNNELSIPTKLNDDELYEDDLEFILKDSESFDDFIDAEDENRPEGEQFEEMWTAKLPDDDELDDKLISYEEYETDI